MTLPPPELLKQDRLVHEAGDVVLDEVVGRAAREHDAVVVLREAVAIRVVDVAVAHDAPVGAREADGHAGSRAVDLDVLHPAIRGVRRRRCRPRFARDSCPAGRPARAGSRCPPTWSPASRPARAGAFCAVLKVQCRGVVSVTRVARDRRDLHALAQAMVGRPLEDGSAVALVHLGRVGLVDEGEVAGVQLRCVRDRDAGGLLHRVLREHGLRARVEGVLQTVSFVVPMARTAPPPWVLTMTVPVDASEPAPRSTTPPGTLIVADTLYVPAASETTWLFPAHRSARPGWRSSRRRSAQRRMAHAVRRAQAGRRRRGQRRSACPRGSRGSTPS